MLYCVAGTLLSEVVVHAGHYAYVFDVWGVAVAVGYRKLALGCFLYFAKAAFGVFCKFLGYLASVGGGNINDAVLIFRTARL